MKKNKICDKCHKKITSEQCWTESILSSEAAKEIGEKRLIRYYHTSCLGNYLKETIFNPLEVRDKNISDSKKN